MSYIELLEEWFQKAKAEGRVVDIKFFELEPGERTEELARAAYETLTGQIETTKLDISSL